MPTLETRLAGTQVRRARFLWLVLLTLFLASFVAPTFIPLRELWMTDVSVLPSPEDFFPGKLPRREGLAGSRVFLVSACGVVFFGDSCW